MLQDRDAHTATVSAVRGHRLGLAGHAWFESYSALTRPPGDLRRSPADAGRLLAHNFPESGFQSGSATATLCAGLARLGIAGGAIYDAFVGAPARHHDQQLLMRDAQARPTYGALGVKLATAAPVG